ncbi:MAG: protein kinase [Sandaracinus sp.]|nr:protein kinase [Sandaracinus sp.]MCB9631012.1 protein kinase [Sandaracinus sp.]
MLPQRIGPYRVLRLLAHGGMGRVYVAQDTRLGRVVALKMAHDDLAARPDARAQFLVEARASARLSHPNVVPVFDVGEDEGVPWAAFEFVEGRTLRHRLKEGALPPEDALRVGYEIASAIAAAHADGIAHRDLKPANVVLGRDGRARVLDFGIARFVESTETAAEPTGDPDALAMLGTPAYMAPEQWRREDGAPADVWALGLLFCEIWLGTHPMARREVHELVAEMARAEPLVLPAEAATLPATVRGLIEACLAKDPAHRPSAAQVVETLLAAARQDETVAPRVELGRLAVRRRALAGLEESVRTSACSLVVGPEASGKSTLLEALVARAASPSCRVTASRDGFAELADAWVGATERTDEAPTWAEGAPSEARSREEVRAWLRESPERVALAASELANVEGTWLLAVDGLETLVGEPVSDDGRAWLSALVNLVVARDARVRLVLAVDEAALGRLPPALFADASVVRLESPGADELHAVATDTLAEVRIEDPEVLDELCEELASDPRPLTMLRYALMEAWRMRDARSGVIAFGRLRGTGIASVASRHADAVFDTLDASAQARARALFVELSLPAPRVSDVLTVAPEADLATLVAAALVLRGADGSLRLGHPALPNVWRRLARWIAERDGDAWVVREVAQAQRRWQERGSSDDDLLRGRLLVAARGVLGRGGFSPEVATFVEASLRADARMRARWRALGVAAAVAALLAVIGLGVAAWSTRRRAEDAESARESSERDRAELLARSARLHWESGDVRTARAQLRRSFELGDSLFGRVLYAGLAEDPERWRSRHAGTAYDVALDAEGRFAFVTYQTGELSRVDLATGEERRFSADLDQLLSARSLEDGRVVTGDFAGSLTVWTPRGDTLEPTTVRRFGRGILRLVAEGPNRVVASVLGGEVRRVDLESGTDVSVEVGETVVGLAHVEGALHGVTAQGRVFRIGFEPPGFEVFAQTPAASALTAVAGTLVVGGNDGRLHFVVSGSDVVRTRPVTQGRIRAMTAVEDGTLLVASLEGDLVHVAGDDVRTIVDEPAAIVGLAERNGVAVLGLGDGARAFEWRAPARPAVEARVAVLNAVVHGDTLLSTAGDGLVVTDRTTGRVVRRLVPFPGRRELRGLVVAPDGEHVALGVAGLGVAVVDLRSGAPSALVFEGARRVVDVQPSEGGVVFGNAAGELVRLGWDGTVERRASGADAVRTVVSPREGVLVSAHDDGSVLWHDDSGTRSVRRFEVAAVGLFVDEDLSGLSVLLSDGSAHRRDASGRWHVWPSAGTRVYRGQRSVDGTRLVAPGADGALHLWSVPSGDHHLLPLANRELNVASFDSRGELVATGGDDGIVRLVSAADGSSPWVRDRASTAFSLELRDAEGTWRAREDGTVIRVRDGAPDASFVGAAAMPAVHLAEGPHDVLVVAYAGGHVELRHRQSFELVASRRLRGDVVHVDVEGEHVHVAADTGDALTIDLAHLGAERCDLLHALWEASPATWVDGDARVMPPPSDHPCRSAPVGTSSASERR